MKKENLILIGAGGHARACLDVVLSTNLYNIIGYIDLKESFDRKYNIPYLGTDKEIEFYANNSSFLVTVGQIMTPEIRINIYNQLKKHNAKLPIIISSNAYVSRYAEIGEGTIVMHGALVQANSIIGANCIINDKAIIEHDVKLGNHCHISTAAVINGGVEIGDNVFIGSNSTIIQNIQIESNSIVGAGSVVLKNIYANKIVYGIVK